jgi:HJR/Mrr/RecB family endonuclease
MKDNHIYVNEEFLNQIQITKEKLNSINDSIIQQAYQSVGIISSAMESIQPVADKISMLSEFANNNIKWILSSSSIEYYTSLARIESNAMQSFQYERISAYIGALANYKVAHCYPDNISNEEIFENKKIDNEIVTKIFELDEETDEAINKKESAIIILSPVNDRLLKYLSENPEAFYQLKDRKFEEVMAEIYSKLGYKVELTKATRDGGKDIIIRRPEILGDFIYYVECKKYAPNNPVGIGLVKNLVGTVDADRINGGILATTSYFTPDARKFVTDNKYDYQIQMHDYNKIREMLNQVV